MYQIYLYLCTWNPTSVVGKYLTKINKKNMSKFGKIQFGCGVETICNTPEMASYIAAISNFPVLSVDEEINLFYQIKNGDDTEKKRAKEKLINSNLRGVVSIVKRQYSQCTNCITIMDLISVGNIGLMKAIDKFDPTMGFRFMSFAVNDIRAAITQEINDHNRIVKTRQTSAPMIHTSLDEPMTDDTNTTLGDVMCTTTDKESCADESLHNDIMRILNTILKPNEISVIRVMFGINTNNTKATLAIEWGCTEERIRQIGLRAMDKLQNNEKVISLLQKYR